MKSAHCAIAAVIAVSTMANLPVLAQTATPSQTAIASALRPIPQALRGGHQGLPVRGSAEAEVRQEMRTNFAPAVASARPAAGQARPLIVAPRRLPRCREPRTAAQRQPTRRQTSRARRFR
jgi:hypothetical protein